eukprot:TRINITY_DN4758_c0_g1_i4.p1 TRINITY_DN4758_c0_g1~~TRINITY_DN4758_c0_g1_i4.p1  ORF type:complete len:710 (-),score=113.68 TRINITY_DN4758_c0_g1_i4:24-2153(-)
MSTSKEIFSTSQSRESPSHENDFISSVESGFYSFDRMDDSNLVSHVESEVERSSIPVCITCGENEGKYRCQICFDLCELCASNDPRHTPEHIVVDHHVFQNAAASLEYKPPKGIYNEKDFVYLDFHDLEIKTGSKFSHLCNTDQIYTEEFNGERTLSTVSFVGDYKTGKSTLIRSLCSPNAVDKLPLINKPCNDVNAYLATLGQRCFAVLDSIGTNSYSPPFPDPDIVSDIILLNKGQLTDNKVKDYVAKKRKCVERAYPRLLYLFSDVLVFVMKGPIQEYYPLILRLREYSKMASANSVKKEFRPFLVLVVNMVSKQEGEGRWDEITQNWLSQELCDYYRDPKIILVPKWEGNEVLCAHQINLLNNTIRSCVRESNEIKKAGGLLLPKEKMFASLEKVGELMSLASSVPINFTEVSLETSKDFASNVFKFYSVALQEFSKLHDTKVDALNKALQLTTEHVVYSYLRNLSKKEVPYYSFVVDGRLLPKIEREMKEIATLVFNSLPCSAVYSLRTKKGNISLGCEMAKNNHASNHLTTKRKNRSSCFSEKSKAPIQWEGGYQKVEGFDEVSIFRLFFEQLLKTQQVQKFQASISPLLPTLRHTAGDQFCYLCLNNYYYDRVSSEFFSWPIELLSCRHLLCRECCSVVLSSSKKDMGPVNLHLDTDKKCPFCDVKIEGYQEIYILQIEVIAELGNKIIVKRHNKKGECTIL